MKEYQGPRRDSQDAALGGFIRAALASDRVPTRGQSTTPVLLARLSMCTVTRQVTTQRPSISDS